MAIQIKNDNVLIGHINELEDAIDSLDSRLDIVENKFSEYLLLTGGGSYWTSN